MPIIARSAGNPTPITKTASVGTACTQIRADTGSTVTILADGAIFIFNGVDDGETSIPSDKIALSETEAEQGLRIKVGRVFINGRVARRRFGGTICVAAQSGTVNVRVIVER